MSHTPDPGAMPGGVYEDTDAFPKTNVFNVYAADGFRIGRWEAPEGITDPELIDAFRGLIERERERLELKRAEWRRPTIQLIP